LSEKITLAWFMLVKLISILRVTIGLFFIVSGFLKGIDIGWFIDIVRGYGILPNFLVFVVSVLIPFFEFLFGLMLVLGLWVRFSSFVLISMV